MLCAILKCVFSELYTWKLGIRPDELYASFSKYFAKKTYFICVSANISLGENVYSLWISRELENFNICMK